MATYYGVKGSSNWNSGNWSTTSAKDASRTGSGVTPTASDDCIIDDWTSDGGGVIWTVNATSCVCKSLVCTGYAGDLAFTASQILAISGNITFANTMTISGTGILRPAASGTLTMAGLTFPGTVSFTSSLTVTLTGNLTITNGLDLLSTVTFAGAYNITCGNLLLGGSKTITLVSGQTLTILSSIVSAANQFGANKIQSGTASSSTAFIYQGTTANCKIAGMQFTDIDASSSSVPIFNWGGGTLTRCTNIYNATALDFPIATDAGKIISGNTLTGIAGTYHEATTAEVQSGVTFGASSALTGTYSGGGGVNMPRTRVGH